VKAVGEQTESGLFFVNQGAEMVFDDWHKGEIIVKRKGLIRPRYIFFHKKEQIAALDWRRPRSGVYEAKGTKDRGTKDLRLDLEIGAMGRSVCAKDEFTRLSSLKIKSPCNPRKAKMCIDLADSDGFYVKEYFDSPTGSFTLHVTKKHYVADLVRIEFNLNKREKSIARIHVAPIMRWEAHHFHQLLALIMAHVAFRLDEHNLFSKSQGKVRREPVKVGRHRWVSI
jgi:hypothetical protein